MTVGSWLSQMNTLLSRGSIAELARDQSGAVEDTNVCEPLLLVSIDVPHAGKANEDLRVCGAKNRAKNSRSVRGAILPRRRDRLTVEACLPCRDCWNAGGWKGWYSKART
jgi:hypothetical protein